MAGRARRRRVRRTDAVADDPATRTFREQNEAETRTTALTTDTDTVASAEECLAENLWSPSSRSRRSPEAPYASSVPRCCRRKEAQDSRRGRRRLRWKSLRRQAHNAETRDHRPGELLHGTQEERGALVPTSALHVRTCCDTCTDGDRLAHPCRPLPNVILPDSTPLHDVTRQYRIDNFRGRSDLSSCMSSKSAAPPVQPRQDDQNFHRGNHQHTLIGQTRQGVNASHLFLVRIFSRDVLCVENDTCSCSIRTPSFYCFPTPTTQQ